MKFVLREIRLLLSGLAFGFVFMPAALWYIYIKYDLYVIVYNVNYLSGFYREIYTRLDNPQTWFYLLLPYLLPRLILQLIRSRVPRRSANTELTDATVKGREDMVKALLTDGKDINACASNGQNPLHLAAEQGDIGVVRILLEHGAMVDAVETAAGYTPLHYAAGRGHTDVCELLIRFGADPDALTGNLDSPLHLAVEKGRSGVVGVLLKYHARLDAKNKNGLTPIQLAEHLENGEIVSQVNQHLSETWPYLQISRG